MMLCDDAKHPGLDCRLTVVTDDDDVDDITRGTYIGLEAIMDNEDDTTTGSGLIVVCR
jgi:hypothetical protein